MNFKSYKSLIICARENIIRIVRYMAWKKINDIRDMTEQDVKRINVPELVFQKLEHHFIGMPQLRWILPKWNNSDIIGGGFEECLDEVMILSEALKLDINIIRNMTY